MKTKAAKGIYKVNDIVEVIDFCGMKDHYMVGHTGYISEEYPLIGDEIPAYVVILKHFDGKEDFKIMMQENELKLIQEAVKEVNNSQMLLPAV
jgi:hypothetical protein